MAGGLGDCHMVILLGCGLYKVSASIGLRCSLLSDAFFSPGCPNVRGIYEFTFVAEDAFPGFCVVYGPS